MNDHLTMTPSEGLLTEILSLLQELNANVEEFRDKLNEIESEIQAINKRIDAVIEQGFPDGDLHKHRRWHTRRIFLHRFFRFR